MDALQNAGGAGAGWEAGLVGLAGFWFGFQKCDFTRENGQKFGLVGFVRFLLERQKPN
jgi:hypothetical protein